MKCRSHLKGKKVIKKKGPEQSVDQIVDKKRGKNKVQIKSCRKKIEKNGA